MLQNWKLWLKISCLIKMAIKININNSNIMFQNIQYILNYSHKMNKYLAFEYLQCVTSSDFFDW